jgi:hypothetical protein
MLKKGGGKKENKKQKKQAATRIIASFGAIASPLGVPTYV